MQPQPRLRAGRICLALALVVATWLGVAGWEARQASQARHHLLRATALFATLQAQLEDGDYAAGRTTVAQLRHETGAAAAATGDPAWRMGGHAPVIGDDVRAVRTVTVVLDELASKVLPPLVSVAAGIEALTPHDGRVHLTALAGAAAELRAADATMRRIRDRVRAIPKGDLATQINELSGKLDRAVTLIGSALRAAELIPPMLGATGPRTYLVLFQNPAEVRATGGMPGAYLVISADHGAVRVIDDGVASGGLATSDTPVLALDPATIELYGTAIARYPANINQTPDFPTVARLAREMYRRHSGRTVDGVLATDPVALSYLLAATGPITVPGGPALRSDTVVRTLLSDVYAGALSRPQQDAYFRGVARATFQALTQRPLAIRPMLAQLARAAGERRLLAWSARTEEERLLDGTVLQGVLPQDAPGTATVGVFLNDGGGGKMSYFLRPAVGLADSGCELAGRALLTVRLTLSSVAPAKGLSQYVRNSAPTLDPSTIRTFVSVFSPSGGTVVRARLDGEAVSLSAGTDGSVGRRPVGIVTVDLKPGQRRQLDVTLLARAETVRELRLWTTPTVTPWQRTEPPPADSC